MVLLYEPVVCKYTQEVSCHQSFLHKHDAFRQGDGEDHILWYEVYRKTYLKYQVLLQETKVTLGTNKNKFPLFPSDFYYLYPIVCY